MPSCSIQDPFGMFGVVVLKEHIPFWLKVGIQLPLRLCNPLLGANNDSIPFSLHCQILDMIVELKNVLKFVQKFHFMVHSTCTSMVPASSVMSVKFLSKSVSSVQQVKIQKRIVR